MQTALNFVSSYLNYNKWGNSFDTLDEASKEIAIREHVIQNRESYANDFAQAIQAYDNTLSKENVDGLVSVVFDKIINKLGPNELSIARKKLPLPKNKEIFESSKEIILEKYELLGEGSFKRAYSAYRVTVTCEAEKSIKLDIKPWTILRSASKEYKNIQEENLLANEFLSPYIVKYCPIVLDIWNSQVCMSMERYPNFLSDIIEKRENYELSQLLRIVKNVTKALAEMHVKGYMHRDIKPENIATQEVISKLGEKKIKGIVVDLGLAKTVSEFTRVAGSPLYQPPECFKANHQDERGDLWGLGVVIAKLLHPKRANFIEEQAASRIKAEPQKTASITFSNMMIEIADSPKDFEDNVFTSWTSQDNDPKESKALIVPQEVKALISKLLKVNPAERGTAQEAYEDLKKKKSAPDKTELSSTELASDWVVIDSEDEETNDNLNERPNEELTQEPTAGYFSWFMRKA